MAHHQTKQPPLFGGKKQKPLVQPLVGARAFRAPASRAACYIERNLNIKITETKIYVI
jgi:hypothetical protein